MHGHAERRYSRGETNMIQTTIKLKLPPSRMQEAMAILRPLAGWTKTVPGCLKCELHRDVLDDDALVFHDSWNTEEDLQRHLRSREYRDLLLVMEMAKEPPEVRFDVITDSSGFEAIEKARIDHVPS